MLITRAQSLHTPIIHNSDDFEFRADVLGYQSEKTDSRPIIFEDRYFRIVPTLGPLHPQHLLICARKNRTGLFEMMDAEIAQLERIMQMIERVFSELHGDNFLMFENGTKRGGRSACSVTQHHLHVVPTTSKFEHNMVSHASDFVAVDSLFHARKEAIGLGDYLLVKLPYQDALIRAREDSPSQYMRRTVAELNGVKEWDWRSADPRSGWIEHKSELQTIKDAFNRDFSIHAGN